jgi:hypothetical protein
LGIDTFYYRIWREEVERISTPLLEVGVEKRANQKQNQYGKNHQIDHTNHETPERTH